MFRLSRLGRRARILLATAVTGGLAVTGIALAPLASAESSDQGTLGRTEMLERAATWLTADNGSQVPYSQTSYWSDGYRQDCSGFVSMALKLGTPGLNTVGLANDRDVTTPISLGELQPGDLLIDADGSNTTRHVVIFAGWTDSAHTSYDAYEQRGGHGTDHRTLDYGLDAGSEFHPYRPVKLTDGGGENPDPPADSWPTVRNGSDGADVTAAQYLLTAHGYDTSADGEFGPATTATTKSFQAANGLVADGVIGPKTWPELITDVSSGDTGDAVKAVQAELNAHGAQLKVDGEFGPLTSDAVKKFQEAADLAVDAQVGQKTWLALVAA